jgi:DNA repair photolyase
VNTRSQKKGEIMFPLLLLPLIRSFHRAGPILHPTPLAADPEVLGLNLTRGCFHRCAFCSARAYPGFPDGSTVEMDRDLPEQLEQELLVKHPRAVFISPSTDPFPPLNEVQSLTVEVVETLARHGVESWLMTRGLIRPRALNTLARHREHVKVTIALTTLDRALQRKLEPLTASPSLRLRQITRLRQLDIPFQVALDPLVPGVTDTAENLQPVLEALAAAGVRQVTAGYMFLRENIAENLAKDLQETGLEEVILEEFQGGPILTAPGMAPARYLSKSRRQRGYARLMSLAAGLDIKVHISALTNPDFGTHRRPDPTPEPRPSLRALFAKQRERA